ncbi:MAG: formate/nitrite transporter family protein [Myxococcales bacterium]|nr:formate/nitrite transporter family protein [Myxococcales bacterium]MCB9703923.1 formate/nitrite transporter family protein [Myxococcales bacterium]
MEEPRIDALLPAEMAHKAEEIGVKKAQGAALPLFALAILAGAFIALGAVFATTVATGGAALPFGVARLLTGLSFCLGLVLVVVGGAELFTGNNLIAMAWASRRITTGALLRNWAIVYAGNFVGAIGIALLVVFAGHHHLAGGAVGATALKIAVGKLGLGFGQAIALGILCNILVCLAVWLTFSARSTTDRILAVIFPIAAFVAAGFEHSVANMYFIPVALLLEAIDPSFVAAAGVDVSALGWGAFFGKNLLPVTIGNVLGGSLFVAATYWAIFLRPRASQ